MKRFFFACVWFVAVGAGAQTPLITGSFTNAFSYTGYSPEVSFEQGIATDGTNNYLFSTGFLRKMDAKWNTILAVNNLPFAGLTGYNHLGAGTYYRGKLYVSAETYNGCGQVTNQSIFVFNPADLSRISVTVVTNYTSEISAVTVAPDLGTNGIVFISNFCDGSKLYEFDPATLVYLGSLTLDSTVPFIQGLAYHGGLIYAVTDSGPNGVVYTIDPNTGHVQQLALIIFPYCREVEGCDYSTGNFWIMATGTSNYVYYFAPLPAATANNPDTLVQNGGFETGDFARWNFTGNNAFVSVSSNPAYVHSGSYGMQAGPLGAMAYCSQTLPTTPGQPYLLSLWLDYPQAATPNEFTVSWNGTVLFDGVNLGAIGWTNLQFTVFAAATNSQLQIGIRNGPAYFGLDELSVAPIGSVPPSITHQSTGQTAFIGSSASFGVTAVGSPLLTYQWYFNTNTPVNGATNAILAFNPVTANAAGIYQVLVANPYGSFTSSPVVLTVPLIPNIRNLSNSAAGAVTLYLASLPTSTNRLWTSTNLIQWQTMATNYADTNGFFQITDTNVLGRSRMFYRLSTP